MCRCSFCNRCGSDRSKWEEHQVRAGESKKGSPSSPHALISKSHELVCSFLPLSVSATLMRAHFDCSIHRERYFTQPPSEQNAHHLTLSRLEESGWHASFQNDSIVFSLLLFQ
ncbi:hypothetical protein CDAR_233701 [Caerostris darwini]|uniref:Uncharacterized protein n=1 Tax=Caerostris darwini TaxID=1538125 RepID=A0AAV4PWN1_9ARAC|nr:hypothetical protein CDAR_233701 [Caerostris darwini]